MKKDYYETLGLKKGATSAEVKSAYRKLAHKYHPDKGDGDEKKFKEVNEAYQNLSDPKKKQVYDQFGHSGPFGQGEGQGQAGGFDWSQYTQGGQAGGFQGDFDFSGMGGFSDIFESFFTGGGRSQGRPDRRGSDLETAINIDFKESVFGVEKELNLTKNAVCDRCKGNGAEPGSSLKTCPECKGEGRIESVRRTLLGNMVQQQVCPTCEGEGKVPEKVCTKCRGEGRVKESSKIKVKIPAGVENGSTVRINGAGEAGKKGGTSGDLYIRIIVKPDARFRREGYNISNSTEISFPEAALGTTVEVLTVDGPIKLKIPAGTQSGKVFKLSDKGVVHPASGRRGGHLVEVNVLTPSRLSKKQKELLEELQKEDGEPKKRWFG
ncbi:molecular chaperone DnaJ [bacterium (Candidatus Howlettbacteria) CG_4_10_14_0_8_um_filter_40_9]|nr:MAG: molecular chaperone DnaJ [bacterium (Candidatus Howlettbacteria) CG_4_10_14_0_8_um_filter_40_9]